LKGHPFSIQNHINPQATHFEQFDADRLVGQFNYECVLLVAASELQEVVRAVKPDSVALLLGIDVDLEGTAG
jgi:hypothetical protein